MPKIRARVTKILEDGTEIELVNIQDHPWFVRPVLKDVLRRINETAPPVQPEGQMEFEVAS